LRGDVHDQRLRGRGSHASPGSNPAVTTAQPINGWWRVGGDSTGGWPAEPTNSRFTGDLDEVAVYPTALSAGRISAHYGRASSCGTAYEDAVLADSPKLYYRLDETSGTRVVDTVDASRQVSYAAPVTPVTFTGSLDEAAVYDHVLTPQRIRATGPPAAPETAWPLRQPGPTPRRSPW
jgi:hypothetical protein